MKAPNKAKKAQSNDWAFLLYGILADYCPSMAFPCDKLAGTFSLAASMPLTCGSFAVQNGYPAVL